MAQWEHPGDLARGRIAASRDIPTAFLCQHQTHWGPCHLSMSHGGCCHFGMIGCDIWALDALWKRLRDLKGLGMRRGTWLLQGSRHLKGSPLIPLLPSPHPASVTQEKKSIFLGKWWHPAPSPDLGVSGIFEEEGDSQGRMVGNCPANKSLFQRHPEPWGDTMTCLAAGIAALALTPVGTPGRKLWFPFPLKLLQILLPPTPDKHDPCMLALVMSLWGAEHGVTQGWVKG